MYKVYDVTFQDGSEREIISTENNIKENYPTAVEILEKNYTPINKAELFKKNERLIYKQSWYYAKKYDIDFEEVRSQAYIVFCEAIDRFDRKMGASFTTYLFDRLRTLDYYCKKEKFTKSLEIWIGKEYLRFGEIIEDRIERLNFYEMVDLLSKDARSLVKEIISGTFNQPGMDRQRSVGKTRIRKVVTKEWGWTHSKVDDVWNEVKTWWNEIAA